MDNKSIAHTRRNCTYHIVFISKYRRKIMYGETKRDIVEILKKLCEMKLLIFEMTWKWAKRRHPNKSAQWIKDSD